MPQRLDNPKQRITNLETNYSEVIKEISVIKQGQDQIEKTVLSVKFSKRYPGFSKSDIAATFT
ncbi:hypothetical protein J7E95_16340 [Streptomyces sp. ISL-14]|uniref:hypothetical protein n=1 Tax=Bacillus sp. ISL-4 TaxID=2819125 RepID=UPI001BE8FDF0|nr:hypothetical protein [Bacillus sp. ISL-4]MBT2672395.1 hypothetical protein [Streptomyces sp. ISL-14]